MQFFNSVELTSSLRIRQLHYPEKCHEEHVSVCHWHDCYELLFCKAGKFLLRINFAEKEIGAGDLVLIEPGVIHQSFCIDAPGDYCVLQCTPTFILGEDYRYSTVFRSFRNIRFFQSDLSEYILKGDKQFYDFFSAVSLEYEEQRDGWLYIVRGMTMQFWGNLIRKGLHQYLNSPLIDSNIMNACSYIEQNYAESLTLNDVAKIAGYSRTYFSKLFKKTLNSSFVDYLSFVRMYHAQQLLYAEQKNMDEIARAVGYNDISSFYRAFKRTTGFTPANFLKLDSDT